MKKISVRGYIIIAVVLGILAVLALYFLNANQVGPSTQKKSGVQLTQNSPGQYQTVIKNGRYLVSAARGITATSEPNNLDVKQFESSLLDLSKSHFKTSRYIFQEGQYLSADKVSDLLARQDKDHEDGLNPKDNGKTDSSREPIYVQTLTEQDFMTKDGDNLKLAGMVVGVAMNTQDQYQKEQYGTTYSQNISDADRIAYGKKIAPKLLQQIRATSGVSKDVPIVIAMYANAPADSLAPGNFYAQATSKDGNSLSSWSTISDKSIVLPKESTDTSKLGDDENNGFANFKNDIANFFPNIADATAVANFHNDKLSSMNVTVTTQFYSQTEIDSFTNYVAASALKFLPNTVPVRIVIQTANEVQAILTRKTDDKSFSVTTL
ncbi:CamS family sex pheromone protein [Leuconostocaceae bacterium ESL0723]|nr:CamS family sex pheromone protein [Lactobacillaceae bacterium L1_55_11]WEV55162.1 CamS family sex pheromone protein [Leuconostocaceae bacterium ESL0723]